MEYKLVTRKPTPAIGYSLVTTPFSPDIGAAWARVHGNGDFQRLMGKSKQMENFGLCIMEKDLPKDHFRYLIAFDHDDSKSADPDMMLYEVAGGEYAVIHAPSIEEISATFKAIYEQWLPTSGFAYDESRPADFEYYYMEGDDVACDIYVPVVKKP